MASFESNAKLPPGEGVDPELQQFITMESQRAQFQSQVHKLTDMCWEQCLDKPRDKLDPKTSTCMSNCVERFIDLSLNIATRFQQMLQSEADKAH
jgi:import inner membrane translocase subunit TIM8